MPSIPFTSEQLRAVRTTGCNVLVSAAAGSGKTAVLAERCAHLVCEASPEERCNIDELLVVTFTEAAADEMRSRIIDALRDRAAARAQDPRLQEQIALAETAQISTIHSYCLWIVRRWFSVLGLDPAATVLDANEASLLRKETLEEVFQRHYASVRSADDPLGTRLEVAEQVCLDSPFQERLVRLIDDYGLGEDRDIAVLVLRLYEFTNSLTQPERWLDEAVGRVSGDGQRVLADLAAELASELGRQAEHCDAAAEALERFHPATGDFSTLIRGHAEQLAEWAETLQGDRGEDTGARNAAGSAERGTRRLEALERVRHAIAEYRVPRAPITKKTPVPPPDVVDARDVAKGELATIREELFQKRLQKRFALFSVEEWFAGIAQTAPYVRTIVDLVRLFQQAFQARKRALGVMEFADLERFAFDLLSVDGDPSACSDVARAIHRRFKHVLVDEFQDVNPLQEAILRLSSRESVSGDRGNLFAVGDVKQSIYRFRLAEPGVFAARLRLFRETPDRGTALPLQRNFRSRAEILEAVNHLFGSLMRDADAGTIYDDEAQLRPGRDGKDDDRAGEGGVCETAAVEVHVLNAAPLRPQEDASAEEQDDTSEADATDEAADGLDSVEGMEEVGFSAGLDPSRWSSAEREAFLIGSRIREWWKSGTGIVEGRPLRYRDVAILLRAAKVKAEQMTAMLARMGIPAHADTGGSLFASVEVRDILSALRVLDNPQQDIPLAGVLRSGVFGGPLSSDDLAEIRCADREAPFHAAVRQYAEEGGSEPLRAGLRMILQRIDLYRQEARLRPLSDLLWRVYEREGYLAYATGLPNGEQRRANLLRLYELARSFGTFRRQGLHRFLRFVDSLASAEQAVDTAAPLGESEDVVRIMSIHRAKGLEFPVVFVAGLGTRFNLQERKGRMIFERHAKIGLRVVDPERMIEFPSAAHQIVGTEIDRCTRQEEMRILYVAMTRARERLVLVGTHPNRPRSGASRLALRSTGHSRTSATSALDWILPVVNSALAVDDAAGDGSRSEATSAPDLFKLREHGLEEILKWRAMPVDGAEVRQAEPAEENLLSVVGRAATLPACERTAIDEDEVDQVLARIAHVYPWLSVTNVAATSAASGFRGQYDFLAGESRGRADTRGEGAFESESRTGHGTGDAAVRRGIVTHRVLQHLDFEKAKDANGLALELQRLISGGVVSSDEAEMVPSDSLAWFLGTGLAERIRRAGPKYRRELSYIAAESPTFFDPGVTCDASDYALVRGIVDGILLDGDGAEIVDFKTDAVSAAEVAERGRRYGPQMELYARAVGRLFGRRVTACRLVFLSAREIVDWVPSRGASDSPWG